MGIIEEIRKKINPTELEYIEDFRKKYIPPIYNQVKLLDYLENDELDHYISISNRSDGKSINYINFFLDYSIRTGIGFFLLGRHYTVRYAYEKFIWKIIDTIQKKYNPKDFYMNRTDFYIAIGYQDKTIGIISELNNAQDLKYHSNFIADFPILIYDEFLALEGDYLPDEWERLFMIYSSVNRDYNIEKIKFPKIFYLGNAVNFSSPVLANLDLYETLESMPMNSIKVKDNTIIEINKNENANEERNLRAFKEETNPMTHAEFKMNKHNLADKDYINKIYKNKGVVIVKLAYNYLRIEYNINTFESLISITVHEEEYNYNYEIKDTKDNTIFLSEKYKSNTHHKKYDKNIFKFKNQYSKDFVLGDFRILEIKINKLISEMEFKKGDKTDDVEKIYKDNYIERSKLALVEKFI